MTMMMMKMMMTMMVMVAATGDPNTGETDQPLVEVNEGFIRGTIATQYNITYLEFLGIPYATPPLGSLRFKNPLPAVPWTGELDASRPPPPCDQLALVGNEDCLYLNVLVPQDALATQDSLPVLVYIHGGAYAMGGSYISHGFQELVSEGLVVVMMQYRLGILGFLSTEDSFAPGNLGLKDQTLALQWINDNIANFGGDVTRITLMGSSAGSTSVFYQMLTPSAAGLFSGVIMESGSVLSPWAKGRKFLATAQKIARRFDCPSLPTEALVTCLQSVGAHLLDMSYFSLYDWNLQPFYLGPRVDEDYMPGEPATLLLHDLYYHVPVVMGVNRDEMAIETVEMYAVPSLIHSLLENFNVNGPASLHLYPDEEPVATSSAIYSHYLGGLHIAKEDADNLTRMFTEGLFHIPHDWTTQLLSASERIFTYELHHRAQHGFTDSFLQAGLDLPQAAKYISHGDINQYFLYPKLASLDDPEDAELGRKLVTMWVNFVKTRNPTPDKSLGFTWEATDPSSLRHLKLLPQPYMETDQRADNRAFWESLPLRINRLLHH